MHTCTCVYHPTQVLGAGDDPLSQKNRSGKKRIIGDWESTVLGLALTVAKAYAGESCPEKMQSAQMSILVSAWRQYHQMKYWFGSSLHDKPHPEWSVLFWPKLRAGLCKPHIPVSA